VNGVTKQAHLKRGMGAERNKAADRKQHIAKSAKARKAIGKLAAAVICKGRKRLSTGHQPATKAASSAKAQWRGGIWRNGMRNADGVMAAVWRKRSMKGVRRRHESVIRHIWPKRMKREEIKIMAWRLRWRYLAVAAAGSFSDSCSG